MEDKSTLKEIIDFRKNQKGIDDGGPAYPAFGSGILMSLRDHFAAKALAGILSGMAYNSDPEYVAESAYQYADAMLKERDKESS